MLNAINTHIFIRIYETKLMFFYLHFILSTKGPLQAADIPQHNSLKSMWSSLFTSRAENNLKVG